jgi:hypothetical protein
MNRQCSASLKNNYDRIIIVICVAVTILPVSGQYNENDTSHIEHRTHEFNRQFLCRPLVSYSMFQNLSLSFHNLSLLPLSFTAQVNLSCLYNGQAS